MASKLLIVAVVAVFGAIVQGKDYGLSKDELDVMKSAFEVFDHDGSGDITVEELKKTLAATGHKLTDSQLQEILEAADQDDDGTINFEEFVELAHKDENLDLLLKKTFKQIDEDESGFITAEELQEGMAKFGKKLSKNETEAAIKQVDSNDDNQLHYSEFLDVMKHLLK